MVSQKDIITPNTMIDFQTCESRNIYQDLEIEEEKVKADPNEREKLPFFKDPKIKISLWTILKESIGKDISRITVPVFFNQPLNLLQTAA